MSAVMTKVKNPILFSGPMVRAILEGRKTVTRRPPIGKTELKIVDEPYSHYIRNRRGTWDSYRTLDELVEKHCPYGKPGDVLWVRETWRPCWWDEDFVDVRLEYKADGKKRDVSPSYDVWTDPERLYEQVSREAWNNSEWQPENVKWRPSIFMPRATCRLKLRVTDVCVERLQEITEEQAIAEGIDEFSYGKAGLNFEFSKNRVTREPLQAFSWLWDNINASRGYGWVKNPYVWVVEFERIGDFKEVPRE